MNEFNEYRITTNSSVFRKLHKHHHASCSYCKWHGSCSENDSWDWYYISTKKAKFPSWKLVSKNKKQWMNKPLKFKKLRKGWEEITWPMKIRPK